jgi:hypothetical protein
MAHVGRVTRASDGELVFYGTEELDRTRVVSMPAGARYLNARLGRTLVRETTGHEGVPWWAEFPDHRRPGKDEWSGWDESAEEGPDEGRPYVGAGTGIPYDEHNDNPATGTYYRNWPPTRAEPDPRDLLPSATWITVRKAAAADPNPLLVAGQLDGLGCGGGCPGVNGNMAYRTRETDGFALGGLAQLEPIQKVALIGVGAVAAAFVGYEIWKASNPSRARRRLRRRAR